MQLIDSHCHFDDPRFDDDRSAAHLRATAAGVTAQIVPSVSAGLWPRVKQTCSRFPALYPAYGLHPMFMAQHQPVHLEQLGSWLQAERPVAVGECGLDYYRGRDDRERQLRYFRAQLSLATAYELPVIIHARRAVEDVIMLLRDFPGLHGVLHSYSGSEEQAHQLIRMGFMLGFGGPVTYPRATRLQRLVSHLPLHALLLESDAPDQPDFANRGERNEPAYLGQVLAAFDRLRPEPVTEIAAATRANTRRLFKLPAE